MARNSRDVSCPAQLRVDSLLVSLAFSKTCKFMLNEFSGWCTGSAGGIFIGHEYDSNRQSTVLPTPNKEFREFHVDRGFTVDSYFRGNVISYSLARFQGLGRFCGFLEFWDTVQPGFFPVFWDQVDRSISNRAVDAEESFKVFGLAAHNRGLVCQTFIVI